MGDKPVSLDKEYELSIEGFTHQGEGVGRVGNFAVFVPGTIPGEKAVVSIQEIKKRYARGSCKRLIHASPHRVEPPCPRAGVCGGCQLQHISYAQQLVLKKKLVEETLARLGGINQPVMPVAGMDYSWRYRNKGTFHLQKKGKKIGLGFYEQGSYNFIPARDCMLFSTRVIEVLAFLEDRLSRLQLEVFEPGKKEGYLKNIIIRESKVTGEMMVIFVTAGGDWPWPQLVNELGQAFPPLVSVYQNAFRTSSSPGAHGDYRLLRGKPTIRETIGPLQFDISPPSFFQVNSLQTLVLYQQVLDYAEVTGKEMVLDAYCGVGTIALYLARQAGCVYGIEVVAEAIEDAWKNAELNQIHNVEFMVGPVEEYLQQWPPSQQGKIDTLVLDPPRKGCSPQVLAQISRVNPAQIIYVSCNPSTLARDLKYLCEQGYTVNGIQPVDMFPQTGHVECVVLITREND